MNYYDYKKDYLKIYRGKQGLNKGLSTGIPKLDAVTFGLQRKYHYTIGGDSGSGKYISFI